MVAVVESVTVPSHVARPPARIAAGVAALAIVVGLALFLDLGRPDFWDPGESRYVETVREMILSGNWLEPTLNFVNYYDKPPGYFWLVGGAFALFGRNEWAARLPSALAATLTIGLLVAFGWRRVGARAALGAGVILATAAQFVALGRSVRMDMVLTLLTTATLLQAFVVFERRRFGPEEPAPATWPLYALPLLGLLVKGPVALVLPGLVIVTFLVATRTTPTRARLRPGFATFAALVLVAAWYALEAVRAPDYLWTFLWQHNLGRFVGRALAGHREPIWFFCWILPLTFLPWTLFLPGAVRHAFRRARRGHRLPAFLLAWCVVPFVFFSLSRAKLATYLLPIFPALALLVAVYVDRVLRAPAILRARAFRFPALAWSFAMAGVALGIPIATAVAYPVFARAALPAIALGGFALLGWRLVTRERFAATPALVAAATLATQVLFYRVGAPVVNEFSSFRTPAEMARDLPPDAAVYAYKTRGHSFTYYGGRAVMRVRSPADAADVLGRAHPTAVLVKTRHLEKIRQHLRAPVCIWWQGPAGRAMLANVPPTNDPSARRLVPATTPGGDDGGSAPRC
jgi:4-amino-4-deoxy-L-arabinose transferase-like glycosyltransferase